MYGALLDWMPWQVAAALVTVVGILLIIGAVCALSWWHDVTIGGTMSDLRDLRERFVSHRVRRLR